MLGGRGLFKANAAALAFLLQTFTWCVAWDTFSPRPTTFTFCNFMFYSSLNISQLEEGKKETSGTLIKLFHSVSALQSQTLPTLLPSVYLKTVWLYSTLSVNSRGKQLCSKVNLSKSEGNLKKKAFSKVLNDI